MLLLFTPTDPVKCQTEELIFDRSVVSSSIVEDYSFVCDESIILRIFSSLYLLGMLFGSFTVGIISDQFGRLKALILSIFVMAASGALGLN